MIRFTMDTVLLLLLATAAGRDMRTHRLPISMSAPVFLLAIIKTLIFRNYSVAIEGLIFMACQYVVLVLANGKIAYGGADFRILAALAVYWGIAALIIVMLASCAAIPLTRLKMGNCVETEDGIYLARNCTARRRGIPYIPPVAFGAYTYVGICLIID